MLGKLIGPDVVELIQRREFGELRKSLSLLSPPTIADILTDMSPEDVAVVFRVLPRDRAAAVFEYMPLEEQEALVRSLGQDQVAAVLNEMAPDDRTALLEELPASVTQRLLTLLSPDERRVATQLLGYPPRSIGRIMTPDYVAVREDVTVGQVLEHIRRVGRDKETLNVIYVVDDKGRLIDDLRIRQLILADPNAKLTETMNREFSALRADQPQEEAVHAFQALDRVALPVVDSSGVLLGIITVDDAMDVAQKEVTEDFHKMGGVEALDAPYFNVGFFTMLRKRAVWLALLFVGEMLTASAMGYFEDEISRALVLALFIPLIISSGGNSGSQASTLVVRAMALREVTARDWWRVLYRELGSGLALGIVLAGIGLARIVFWPWRLETYGPHYVAIGLTVAASLVGVVLFGTVFGSMLPLLMRRLRLDPAVCSAPFVATLVDVTGIVIYFSVAAVLLRGTLL